MSRDADAPPEALAALDDWLAAREAAYGDVREGADARIVWAGGRRERTPLSLVYLHGFSASRRETAPLCDRIANALGANLFYARLAGHGRTSAAMGEARMADWLADAERAWALATRLGERVVLVGTSTGGTLATLFAAQRPDPRLAALLLVAPNFGPRDRRSALLNLPGARWWAPRLVGPERIVEPENEGHARYWTTRYPTTALIPMMQLVGAVRRAPLERLVAPTLVCYHPEDDTVDSRLTERLLPRFGARPLEVERVAGDAGSRHVIAGDVFAPHATEALGERAVGFLRRYA